MGAKPTITHFVLHWSLSGCYDSVTVVAFHPKEGDERFITPHTDSNQTGVPVVPSFRSNGAFRAAYR